MRARQSRVPDGLVPRRSLGAVEQRARPRRGLARDPRNLTVLDLRPNQHHPADPSPRGDDVAIGGARKAPRVAPGRRASARLVVPRALVATHLARSGRAGRPRPPVPRVPRVPRVAAARVPGRRTRHRQHVALVRGERRAERGVGVDVVGFGASSADLHGDLLQPRRVGGVARGDVRAFDSVQDAGPFVPRDVGAVVRGAERHLPGLGGRERSGDRHAVPARPVPSDERPEWRVVHRPREAVRARRERLAPGLDPRVDRAVVISHQRRARVLRGEVGSHTREGGERDREAQEDDDGAEVVEEVAAPRGVGSHHVRTLAPAVLLADQD